METPQEMRPGRPVPWSNAIATAYANAGQPYGNTWEDCCKWAFEQIRHAERMRAFMEFMPSAEPFTTDNALQLYESWEEGGQVDAIMRKQRLDEGV